MSLDPRLGRLQEFDERSRGFRAASLYGAALPTVKYLWQIYKWIDQGPQGSCVGHAFTDEANSLPYRHSFDHNYAVGWYYDAQRADSWPGGEYPNASPFYEGTSVLAGAKVGQARGFYGAYHWAFSVEEAAAAVSGGPVIFGINWYDSMMDPEGPLYQVRPDLDGGYGGHAIMCRGFYPAKSYIWIPTTGKTLRLAEPMFRLRNSWGKSWGTNGDCLISVEDMRVLLQQGGETCVPTDRKQVTV